MQSLAAGRLKTAPPILDVDDVATFVADGFGLIDVDPSDGVIFAPRVADRDLIGGLVITNDHAKVEVGLGGKFWGANFCGFGDFNRVSCPVLNAWPDPGSGVGNGIVVRKAAHLPKDGHALIEVAFDFTGRE